MSGIDFVIPWVDSSDKTWQNTKAGYQSCEDEDSNDVRYRDWDNLRYWFRGVEKYAPWVRKIHFVTYGQIPKWMNREDPRLHIVFHEDYIPHEYLPTFNSHTIELNMHRIEGLSERFIYFNDDMFLINKVRPTDFFVKMKPKDMLAFQPVVANPVNPYMSHILLNNILALSRHFQKRKNVFEHPGNYFRIGYPPLYFLYNILELSIWRYTGLYTVHGPSAFCRSMFEQIWDKESKLLDDTCRHHFRNSKDVSQYLIREWQKLAGEFYPSNITRKFRYFNIGQSNVRLYRTIEKQKANIICINDTNEQINFLKIKEEMIDAFEKILSEPSVFER